jgi:hypothetical protein
MLSHRTLGCRDLVWTEVINQLAHVNLSCVGVIQSLRLMKMVMTL